MEKIIHVFLSHCFLVSHFLFSWVNHTAQYANSFVNSQVNESKCKLSLFFAEYCNNNNYYYLLFLINLLLDHVASVYENLTILLWHPCASVFFLQYF